MDGETCAFDILTWHPKQSRCIIFSSNVGNVFPSTPPLLVAYNSMLHSTVSLEREPPLDYSLRNLADLFLASLFLCICLACPFSILLYCGCVCYVCILISCFIVVYVFVSNGYPYLHMCFCFYKLTRFTYLAY